MLLDVSEKSKKEFILNIYRRFLNISIFMFKFEILNLYTMSSHSRYFIKYYRLYNEYNDE